MTETIFYIYNIHIYICVSVSFAEVWTRVTWLGLKSDLSYKFDDFRLDSIIKDVQLDLYFNISDSWLWTSAFWLENIWDLKQHCLTLTTIQSFKNET